MFISQIVFLIFSKIFTIFKDIINFYLWRTGLVTGFSSPHKFFFALFYATQIQKSSSFFKSSLVCRHQGCSLFVSLSQTHCSFVSKTNVSNSPSNSPLLFLTKSCTKETFSATRSLLRRSDVSAFASAVLCRRRHLLPTSVGKSIYCRMDTRPEKKIDRNVMTNF